MLDILMTPLGPELMIVFATSDVPTTKLTMAEHNSHLCSTMPYCSQKIKAHGLAHRRCIRHLVAH